MRDPYRSYGRWPLYFDLAPQGWWTLVLMLHRLNRRRGCGPCMCFPVRAWRAGRYALVYFRCKDCGGARSLQIERRDPCPV